MEAAKTRATERMYKLCIFILLIVFFASCKTALPVIQLVNKDSIVLKDTIIYKTITNYLPGDTVEMWQAIDCPDAKLDTVIKKGNTRLTAKIKNGFIKVNCQTDSLQHVIDSITRIKQKEVYKTKTVLVPTEVIKNRIPKWVWLLLTFNVLMLAYKFRFSILKMFP